MGCRRTQGWGVGDGWNRVVGERVERVEG